MLNYSWYKLIWLLFRLITLYSILIIMHLVTPEFISLPKAHIISVYVVLFIMVIVKLLFLLCPLHLFFKIQIFQCEFWKYILNRISTICLFNIVEVYDIYVKYIYEFINYLSLIYEIERMDILFCFKLIIYVLVLHVHTKCLF